MNPEFNDLTRLRTEYSRRAADPLYSSLYSNNNRADMFLIRDRDYEIVKLLNSMHTRSWERVRVLDVGCGEGHQLARFLLYGAESKNLFGMDLLEYRVESAKNHYPSLQFAVANALALPYPDRNFDLVLLFTVFTSILQERIRVSMAREVLRVLAPSGQILWYDFRANPRNRHTRGIGKMELLDLFPNCRFEFRKATLAPPIARLLAPYSLPLCSFLNRIPPLKTHYLALITPN